MTYIATNAMHTFVLVCTKLQHLPQLPQKSKREEPKLVHME